MPVINWISVLRGDERNGQDLIRLAKKMMDEVVKLPQLINGQQLPIDLRDYRMHSPVLDLVLPENNILNVKAGATSVVVDGFWIFFRPLARQISIETYGACRSGKTQIAVHYQINS